jgi:peptide-methionine (S)-S-oxide reductase
MSIIFFHNDGQKRLAIESKDHEAARIKGKIFTEIIPIGEFYVAEDYHQKYRLRSERELMRELRAIYPTEKDFVNSTAAARINGYLDGYGTLAELQEELPGFGLSPATSKGLMEIVKRRKGRAACKL